jgi:hypothetical protein
MQPTIRRRTPQSTRVRTGLIRHASSHTSQNGEDGIIRRIFQLLPHPDHGAIRTCVDVGAWDGRHLSNTFSLLFGHNREDDDSRHQWKGVLIEADPLKFRQLQDLHSQTDNICICASVSCQVGSSYSLRRLLSSLDGNSSSEGESGKQHWRLERDFDFLCIDVDGTDYWLLHDLLGGDDEKATKNDGECNNSNSSQQQNTSSSCYYRPRVICIEFNPTMPNDLIYIQPRCDSIRQGSSLSALVELANSFDYVLVETTVFNAFFVKRDLYEEYLKEEVPDTSIEALYEVTMGTQLYQLYDGK